MSNHAASQHLKDAVKHRIGEISGLCVVLFNEIMRTRIPSIGGAVAFFMLLSLVPLLMAASALLGSLPIPNLFQQLLDMMSMLVPRDGMVFVKGLLQSIMTPNAKRILSFGILSYLWAASGTFIALIDALNIAYDVKTTRPWWRDRLQALLLTFTSGGLAVVSLLCVIVGPRFLHFVSYLVPIPDVFTLLWPPVRVAVILVTFVLGLELLYYLGPNVKHSLRSTLPGAALAVGIWFLGSTVLSYYLQHLSNYSATYGSLGAVIGLMLWLYLSAISVLVGAELNAELIKRRARALQPELQAAPQPVPPSEVQIGSAASVEPLSHRTSGFPAA